MPLDVDIARAGGFASLRLISRLPKAQLQDPVAKARPAEIEEIRTNLVTWFSVFSFDVDLVRRELPTAAEGPALIYPGMIFQLRAGPVCVVDHWGSYNDYPLLYVAPIDPAPTNLSPLDVEVSEDYRDLFHQKFFVRTDEFFLLDRENLPAAPSAMLRFGLMHLISRAFALKFGRLSLLL